MTQTISKDTPLIEITLRKYEKPYFEDKRDLVRKYCLSLGLLQPGDSRDIIVDILHVIIDAEGPLNSEKIRERTIKARESQNLPLTLQLFQNYPNPFNSQTRIKFSIPENSKVELNIYDIRGRFVRAVFNGDLKKGFHEKIWDSRNNSGNLVSTGVYFYQLKYEGENIIKKMYLIK